MAMGLLRLMMVVQPHIALRILGTVGSMGCQDLNDPTVETAFSNRSWTNGRPCR